MQIAAHAPSFSGVSLDVYGAGFGLVKGAGTKSDWHVASVLVQKGETATAAIPPPPI